MMMRMQRNEDDGVIDLATPGVLENDSLTTDGDPLTASLLVTDVSERHLDL